MAEKTPVRVNYDGNGNAIGFAELQSTEFIGIDDGGTGAITASGARTALGLSIGTDIQAYDTDLATIAGLSHADGAFIVSNGSAWTVESGATARASLGLGSSNNPTFNGVNLSVLNLDSVNVSTIVVSTETFTSNDNDTSVPTTAAIIDYISSQVTLEDLDFGGDTGTGAVDLDSQTFTIQGTANEIETSASGQTLTIGLPSSITTTLSATSVLSDGVVATTQSVGVNSTKVATTAYVDAQVTAEDLDFGGDTGTGSVDLDSQTFTIAGTANEIETSATGQTLTIGLPSSITVDVVGNLTGNVTGNVTGNLTGNVTGDLTGDVTGNVTGNVTGDVTGDVTGNLTGNVTGNLTGNVTGDVTGDVTGNLTGNV